MSKTVMRSSHLLVQFDAVSRVEMKCSANVVDMRNIGIALCNSQGAMRQHDVDVAPLLRSSFHLAVRIA